MPVTGARAHLLLVGEHGEGDGLLGLGHELAEDLDLEPAQDKGLDQLLDPLGVNAERDPS
eukprot:COSAG05_NODE_12377_length_470_cov_1.110512_1_plen_59_part_10